MPPHASTSSAASGTVKPKDRAVQTHNAKHTLRAGSRQKVSQLQRATQSQQHPGAEASGSASGSSLQLDQLDLAPPQQSQHRGAPTVVPPSGGKGKQREGPVPKNAAAGGKAGAGAQPQRKQVFKQVLGSPLTVNWPTLPAVEAQPILYTLLDLLAHPDIAHLLRQGHAQDRRCMSRGQRRQARKSRRVANEVANGPIPEGGLPKDSCAASETTEQAAPDSIHPRAQRLVYGINTVTRRLELMIAEKAAERRQTKARMRADSRQAAQSKSHEEDVGAQPSQPSPPGIRVVFVCQRDLDPPKLAAHFPMLACAVNAVCYPKAQGAPEGVVLVPLPEGAELLLCKALGTRRCAALALCFGPDDDLGAVFNATSTATSSSMGSAAQETHAMDIDPRPAPTPQESAQPPGRRPPLSTVVKSLWERIAETGNALKPLRARWLDAAADCVLGSVPASLSSSSFSPAPAPKLSPAPVVLHTVASTAPANLNAHKLAKRHTRDEKKAWRKGKKREAHEAAKRKVKVERKGRREARRTQKRKAMATQ